MTLGSQRRCHIRGNNKYTADTHIYIVRFCRQYGARDVEPFEVRARNESEALKKSLNLRWAEPYSNKKYRGIVVHDPETSKIKWVGDDGTTCFLSGEMKIEVITCT